MFRITGVVAIIVSLLFGAGAVRAAAANGNTSISGPEVSTAGAVSVSPPVRNLPPGLSAGGSKVDRPLRLIPPRGANGGHPDTVIQSSVSGPAVATSSGLNFAGVGNGDYGFSPNAAPPDTNGAVGATQYVQWVNESFAVFDKTTGAIASGFPKAGNTLWSGLKDSKGNPSGCAVNNDGDPIAQYDKAANRWIMTQFSVTNPSTYGYLQCVAVSKTSDATGSYYQYAFPEPNFNDYPKLGVWPDAYYLTFNIFNGNSFQGGRTCALDRAKMLVGDPTATQVCFQFSATSNIGNLLPSDLDGSAPPPTGAPNYVLTFGSNSLDLYKFHVDFSTPANSSLTGPTTIQVASFSPACNGGGTCIPQSGTTQQLDSLADRLMYRLAYRNFGDHESLVVDHAVTAGTSVGMRWYELRNLSTSPTVFQQGTYAPDSKYRWMGSIAMDKVGDIAMGYSVSSSSTFPSIAYTGRVPTDALGTMETETAIQAGGGSQSGSNLTRWGDYSAMTVDPTNDCTFWYTSEYLKATGAFNWSTKIASFTFPGCAPPANDFSISASPTSLSLAANAGSTSTISTALTTGTAGTVNLLVSGTPAGATATLNPTSVTAGGSSTLSVNAGTAAPGTYTLTVTGTEGSATHTTTVGLTVTAPPPSNDFSMSASPGSVTVTQGQPGGTTSISTTITSGSAQSVALSASGLPSGVTASFNPTSVTSGGSSTLTLTASATATTGTSMITITGTGASATHTTTVSLTVNAAVTSDFSISASPTSLQEPRNGGSTFTTVTVTPSNGFTGAVALTTSALPSGVSKTFTPATVNGGTGTSTLTFTTTGAQNGTYTVTVTGTSGSLSHSTTLSLKVTRH